MSYNNKPTQILPLVTTLRKVWNNTQSKKTMFGYQTDLMLTALTTALAEIGDEGVAIDKKAWTVFDRRASDLLDQHQKREVTDRRFILQGLMIFYDTRDQFNPHYHDFVASCQVFDKKVNEANYNQSSVPLMLARVAVAA